jgi:O-acetyl-ADP-ribose deacetylase (regulator of RNase III)
MKIEYRQGDLFETDIKAIAHGCNAQGVMGSGVAKIIYDRFPRAYERYVNEYKTNLSLNLGHVIAVPENGKIIINAITQEYYGKDGKRYVSYDAVADAMITINKFYDVYGITSVAMPQIGAGLGGGDWNVISAIIESELTQLQPVVYIL